MIYSDSGFMNRMSEYFQHHYLFWKHTVMLHSYFSCWNNYMCQTELRLIENYSYEGWPSTLNSLKWILWDQNSRSRSVSPRPGANVQACLLDFEVFLYYKAMGLPTPPAKGEFPLSKISSWGSQPIKPESEIPLFLWIEELHFSSVGISICRSWEKGCIYLWILELLLGRSRDSQALPQRMCSVCVLVILISSSDLIIPLVITFLGYKTFCLLKLSVFPGPTRPHIKHTHPLKNQHIYKREALVLRTQVLSCIFSFQKALSYFWG
jgi:hypothetical protein